MNNVHLYFGTYNLTQNFSNKTWLPFLSNWLCTHCIQRFIHSDSTWFCVIIPSIFSQDFRFETTDNEIFQESESDINYMLQRCLLITRSQPRVSKITLRYCFCGYWVSPLRELKELTMKCNKSYSDPDILSHLTSR